MIEPCPAEAGDILYRVRKEPSHELLFEIKAGCCTDTEAISKCFRELMVQRDDAQTQVGEAAWQLYMNGSHRAEGGYHCPIDCTACDFLASLGVMET